MDRDSKAAIHLLWDKIASYGASSTEEALNEAMKILASLVGAHHAYWMGALRLSDTAEKDPVQGWRPRAVTYLNPTSTRLSAAQEHIKRINTGRIDPTIVANLKKAGQFRVNIAHEIRPAGWLESEFYERLFKPFDINDTIYVASPIGSDIESWFAFERLGQESAYFGEAERELLDYAVRPLKWFHRQLILHHGVMLADEPLKPAERRIVNSLLTEMTEQEIAKEHGLAQSTVHTYCTRIFRKFNVRGRAGLIALWLGKIPAP
jgi:DNA-binding CsgD family transcriptional regulator